MLRFQACFVSRRAGAISAAACLILMLLLLLRCPAGFAGTNPLAKSAVHVLSHDANRNCAGVPAVAGCGDISTTYAGADFDAFPVFFNLTEYLGLEYGLTWPEWTYGAAWTSCSLLSIGGITAPGDGVVQAWGACQTGQVVAGWVWLYADTPGNVSVVPHPETGDILVLDCNLGVNETVQNFSAGVFGGTGDDPCTPTPSCLVSPEVLDFGVVNFGSSADLPFTVRNTGSVVLEGDISSPCSDFEVIAGDGPYSLEPGDTLDVQVRFSPSVAGSSTCDIDTGLLCASVSCTAEGDPSPICSVSPGRLLFGALVGETSVRNFRITNTGGSLLEGNVVETCDAFTIIEGGGAYALAGGEELLVRVEFHPDSAGIFECEVETGTDCANVNCSGTADDQPECAVEPDSLDFGDVNPGSQAELTFTIENTGGSILEGVISEACAEFALVNTVPEFTLRTGQVHEVIVRFAPVSLGPKMCTVETGTELCPDVDIRGVGWDMPVCSITPASLDFGYVGVGDSITAAFMIENTGGDLLEGSMSDGTCGAVFGIVGEDGTYMLEPGEAASFEVWFSPVASGPVMCHISHTNTSGSCLDIECSGNGLEDISAVHVDIMPAECPNQVRIDRSGLVRIAVLGSADLDVMDVVPSSIRLRRDGMPGEVSPLLDYQRADVATPFMGPPCGCHGLSGDGLVDLIMTFRIDDLAILFDPPPENGTQVPIRLTGLLGDGSGVLGEDCVKVISGIWGEERYGDRIGLLIHSDGRLARKVRHP
ncbi:choice-of-anchor D domain-containing protein [Candidatus Eisenbacteria bacterium]|uniref:Choice-of-anchor D domain-containing protein n=1 Tax=Eiseniibacteriota bacterium TaxID=2212470 RepID=A0ABV6YNA1_UNCEI